MSELAATAVFGPANRNSGNPRFADIVAHLYVGGSGLWEFRRLGAGSDMRDPSMQATTPFVLRIESRGSIADELAAGFALAAGLKPAVPAVEKRWGPAWSDERLELSQLMLRDLAALAADVDVAVLVTLLSDETARLASLQGLPWSVVVATPSKEFRHSQWD